jgi:hypothetical protein
MGTRTISYEQFYCDICNKIRASKELTLVCDIEICEVCL